MSKMIAIDFGNRFCKVAVADSATKSLDLAHSHSISQIPSSLALGKDGSIKIGFDAEALRGSADHTIVDSLKRLVGLNPDYTGSGEPSIHALAWKTEEGVPFIQVDQLSGKHVFSFTKLISMFLWEVIALISSVSQPQAAKVVITVPTWFTRSQRDSLIDACKMADLNLVGIITDMTAMLLDYGLTHLLTLRNPTQCNVVFVDIGDSDSTFAVVTFRNGRVTIKSILCDSGFGSHDSNHAIVRHLGLATMGSPTLKDLLFACEKLGETVATFQDSTQATISEPPSVIITGESLNWAVSSVSQIPKFVREAVAKSGLTLDEIHLVHLAGGSTLLATTKQSIVDVFPETISVVLGSLEMIARGSLYACYHLRGAGYFEFDENSLSAIIYDKSDSGIWERAIGQANTTIEPSLELKSDNQNQEEHHQIVQTHTISGDTVDPVPISNIETVQLQTPNLLSLAAEITEQIRIINSTSDSSFEKHALLGTLGSLFSKKYSETLDIEDLLMATAAQVKAVALAVTASDKARYLNNVALLLQQNFDIQPNMELLDKVISCLLMAVALSISDSNNNKIKYLNNLSNSLYLRYEKQYNIEDFNEAITNRKSAINLIPDDDHSKSKHLNMLGLMLESRYDRLSDDTDLLNAISVQEKSILLAVDDDGQKAAYHFNLGVTLSKLFTKVGNPSDLDKSIQQQQLAIDIAMKEDSQKAMYLNHLGESLQDRFIKLWNLEDLTRAIISLGNAVDLMHESHQSKPVYLNNLGKSLGLYFTHQKSLPHLEEAIETQRMALKLTPLRNRALYLRNLALLLESHSNCSPENTVKSLEEAIECRQQAIILTPDFLPGKVKHFVDLSGSLYTYYKQTHLLSALDKAIVAQRDAVKLNDDKANQEKPDETVFSLGVLLRELFDRSGNLEALEDAIPSLQKAVNSVPHGHPTMAQYLNHLGAAFHVKFLQLNRIEDLELSLQNLQKAIDLTPNTSDDKGSYITNFTGALHSKFEYFQDSEALIQAVNNYRLLVELTPNNHQHKATRLNNLGVALRTLFESKSNIDDLNQSVTICQAAVAQSSGDSVKKLLFLSNLATSLQLCWTNKGKDITDLDAAIKVQHQIVDQTPDEYPNKGGYLSNLGNSLEARFEELGEINDLNNAIWYHTKAVDVTPRGHSIRPKCLNNLGNSLRNRFYKNHKIEDLQAAIVKYEDAVAITPKTSNDMPLYMSNLGISLSMHFDHVERIADLNQSVSLLEAVVEMASVKDSNKSSWFTNLGGALRKRGTHMKDLVQLDQAISCFQHALDIIPDDHPQQVMILLSLGHTFEDKFNISSDQSLLQSALTTFKQASQPQSGPHLTRFRASLAWISCASINKESSILEAYSSALDLLPQLAWLGLSTESQLLRLGVAHSIACDAAATALKHKNVDLALEWLEQGRSVVWAQILQLRQPLEQLRKIDPVLSQEIQEVSAELEKQRALGAEIPFTKELQTALIHENHIESQHRLAKSWDNLMYKVKEIPEFKDMFRRRNSLELKEAAHCGPVVVLNVSKIQCDAIVIVSPSLPLLHLPLDSISYDDIYSLQKKLFHVLQSGLHLCSDNLNRYGHAVKFNTQSPDNTFRFILNELWNKIAKPVLDLIGLHTQSNSLEMQHIWWCPTSHMTFLPLHAAGIYGNPGQTNVTLADYAVSSYIPNLGTLLRARSQSKTYKSPKFLAVVQAETPGQGALPGTIEELRLLKSHISDSNFPVDVMQDSTATVQLVTEALTKHSWIHFSCHGVQNLDMPTLSGLLLHDGLLSLQDIIHNPLQNAEFAFLSACQTATGDYLQPDEAMHLAGGMMLAGIGSVVATMWSVGDQDAPLVADQVYKYLLRNNQPSGLESAHALHEAIQTLRHQYHNKSFASWVPFIHMGL